MRHAGVCAEGVAIWISLEFGSFKALVRCEGES